MTTHKNRKKKPQLPIATAVFIIKRMIIPKLSLAKFF
jgi:hypothetical protein